MNVKKTIRTVFSPNIYKLLFILVSILGVCPLIGANIDPFLKLFHLYTLIVLAFDLFGERRILRNKGRIFLVIFGTCYAITLLTNPSLRSVTNISNFCYLLAELGIIFSYGQDSKKFDRISSYVICTFVSLCNAAGIWMFFSKTNIFIEGRGYIGIFPYENRLSGLFGNPNVLGLVCLCAIGLCAISFILSKRNAEKIYFGVLGGINLITLLLSNSRTQMYALILTCAVVTFLWILKSHISAKRALIAGAASMLCAGVVFTAFSLTQFTLSKLDFNYGYYLQNICLDNLDPSIDTQNHGIFTEDGVMYYYEGGRKKAAGLVKIDNIYYYVDSSCKVVTGTYNVEKTNDMLPAGTYEFGDDGKMLISASIKNGIFVEGGVKYYYENDKKSYAGFVKIEDDYYYIDAACTVAVGEVHVKKTNGLIPAGTYEFDEDGKLIRNNGEGDPLGSGNQSTIGRNETEGFNGRIDLWLTGLRLFAAKPLFGYGLDNLTNAISEIGLPPLIVKGNLHNTYIDVLVSCGLAGFVCLALFLLTMLGETVKFFRFNDRKSWMQGAVMLAVVVGFMLDGMADSTILSSFYPTSACFWFISSQLANLLEEVNKQNGQYTTPILHKLSDRIFDKKR